MRGCDPWWQILRPCWAASVEKTATSHLAVIKGLRLLGVRIWCRGSAFAPPSFVPNFGAASARQTSRVCPLALVVGTCLPRRSSPAGRAKSGWEAGIRTPITWFRATGPTVERPPSMENRGGTNLTSLSNQAGPIQGGCGQTVLLPRVRSVVSPAARRPGGPRSCGPARGRGRATPAPRRCPGSRRGRPPPRASGG